MEVKVLKRDKNEVELELGSLTIAEVLRVYLNKNPSVTFAAWKREHPTRNPVLKFKTSGKDVQMAIEKAVKEVVSDIEKLEEDFKKSK